MKRDAIDVIAADHEELQQLFARVSSVDEDRPKVLKELVLKLSAHVAMEKQLVIPVTDRFDDDGGAADLLSRYHDEIEHLLVLIDRRKVNSPDMADLVNQLLDLTKSHVADVDAALLPQLRRVLTNEELLELGAVMDADERSLMTHPHPHLPTTGPLAAGARRVASLIDRGRDNSADVNRAST